jgi:hypothetical protein
MFFRWPGIIRMTAASFILFCGAANATPADSPRAALRNTLAAHPPAIGEAGPQSGSRIRTVSIAGSQSAGTFLTVDYIRTWGSVSGVVASNENVHGLASLPRDANGFYEYESQFEIIAPAKTGTNSVIIVEGENRGSPVYLNNVTETTAAGPPSPTTYEKGYGNGFLFRHATSYARVQWQTGIAASVPDQAEGVGEVILRDFARWLAGRTKLEAFAPYDPGAYQTRILTGISLGGFFVNTFIAEGFNADPQTGHAVFDGAIAVDGTGNWIALNQLAAENGSQELPYVLPNGKPLDAAKLLSRPESDPFYIDIANYTDFYRLRASLTDRSDLPAKMRRYDWPSPHAAAPIDQSKFLERARKCNGGVKVDLNPISYAPYLRAVTLALEHELGVRSARNAPSLPPTTLFKLGPAPESTANFNPLPGAVLKVPVTDLDDQPQGGVRFPEVEHPIGRPKPVALPPVSTGSIDATCANLGEWQQFSPEELAPRYIDQGRFLQLYAHSVDRLIEAGYLLYDEKDSMVETAALLYKRKPSH